VTGWKVGFDVWRKRAEAAEARVSELSAALRDQSQTLHGRDHLPVAMEACQAPRCEAICRLLGHVLPIEERSE
jgi:hypothetical protein